MPGALSGASSGIPQLPADFVRLQQLYASMQDQPGLGPSGSVGSEAAAGFLNSLQAAYGGGSQQQQQQPASAQETSSTAQPGCTMLSVQAFADQADFVGLVAAVLSAVQVRGAHVPMCMLPCMSASHIPLLQPVLLPQGLLASGNTVPQCWCELSELWSSTPAKTPATSLS